MTNEYNRRLCRACSSANTLARRVSLRSISLKCLVYRANENRWLIIRSSPHKLLMFIRLPVFKISIRLRRATCTVIHAVSFLYTIHGGVQLAARITFMQFLLQFVAIESITFCESVPLRGQSEWCNRVLANRLWTCRQRYVAPVW